MPADPTVILGYEPAEICWSTHPSWPCSSQRASRLYNEEAVRRYFSQFHRRDVSCGPGQLSVVVTVVSFLADPASCLSLVSCSISVSHRSPLCRFLRTRPFPARGSWVSLYVEWLCWLSVLVYLWCGAAGSLSTGLLVVWGCWGSLYWSTGGVELLDLSLLVYWWCGAAGSLSTGLLVVWGCWISLYWSGGVGLLDLSLLVYWWCGAAGSLSTGLVVWGCWISLYWSIGGVGLLDLSLLVWWCGAAGSLSTGLVVWGCWISLYWSGGVGLLDLSLLVYWWCGAAGSLYWSTGGVGLLGLSTGLLVLWGCWFSLLDYWWCGGHSQLVV